MGERIDPANMVTKFCTNNLLWQKAANLLSFLAKHFEGIHWRNEMDFKTATWTDLKAGTSWKNTKYYGLVVAKLNRSKF
jgi:hypothetical protein